MANVTKKDLVELIAGKTGLTQVDTKVIVETLFESVARSLQEGHNIEIRGFGRFKIKKKKERIARNPRTGASVNVKEGLKPIFEASKELKVKINEKRRSSPSRSAGADQAYGPGEKPAEPIY